MHNTNISVNGTCASIYLLTCYRIVQHSSYTVPMISVWDLMTNHINYCILYNIIIYILYYFMTFMWSGPKCHPTFLAVSPPDSGLATAAAWHCRKSKRSGFGGRPKCQASPIWFWGSHHDSQWILHWQSGDLWWTSPESPRETLWANQQIN